MKAGRLSASLVSIAIVEAGSGLAAPTLANDHFTFASSEIKDGRPANFYELVFEKDASVCSELVDALNEPQAVPDEFRSPRYHAEAEQIFFLKNRFSVPWEQRTFLIPMRSPSGEVEYEEMETASLQSSSLDLFNSGKNVEILKFTWTKHDITTNALFASFEVEADDGHPRCSFGDQCVFRRYYRDRGPVDLRTDGINLSRVDSNVGRNVGSARAPTLAEALYHGADDYSYLDIVRVAGRHFTLMMPARTAWANRERFANDIRLYVLASTGHRQHELICEMKSRFVQTK